MSADECLITDESCLSDFSSCGMPDELANKTSSLKELYAAWNLWVLGALRFRYGLRVRLEAGSCVHQLPSIRHRELGHSEDVEMLEVKLPGDFVTEEVASVNSEGRFDSR